ncbi:hypothetical protein ACFL2S_05230 [Thermodesulfobacteriota bacterium]
MLSAIYALLGRNQDAQAAYHKSLKAWNIGYFPAELVTVYEFGMTSWTDHSENGRLMNTSSAIEGKWWIEG